METDKKPMIVSEHNTNQNEATAGRHNTSFEKIGQSKTADIASASGIPLPEDEPGQEMVYSIPSIIITPPSVQPSQSNDESTCIDNHNAPVDQSQTFPCLNPKTQDTNNTSCPEIGHVTENQTSQMCTSSLDTKSDSSTTHEPNCPPSKCTMDTSQDVDMDVAYNCSSTPIKESTQCTENKLEDTQCSMMSIDAPSPIAKDSVSSPISEESTRQQPISTSNNACSVSTHSFYNQHNTFMSPQNHNARSQKSFPDTPRPAFDISRNSSPYQSNSEPRQHDSDSSMTGRSQSRTYHHAPSHQHMPGNMGEFYSPGPSSESSWTDMSYRPDMSIPPLMPDSGYPPSGMPDNEYFVYPSIYVSSAGLISVLLRNDMSVEMTVDRTIRVVSHNHMMAVATDSRGTAACVYHPAAKVFQVGATTDIATDDFRARMGNGECILFSNGIHYFKLEDSDLQPTAPVKFSDISRDQSVNLLFSSEGYGESLVASCMQVASQAEYSNLPKGGVIVRINGVKVTQTGGGDVSVVTGAKFIRLSPHLGTARLGNRFVDIEIEKDWTVKLTKGSHSFISSRKCAMVCNGKMEAGFDENSSLKAANLVPRHPMVADAGFMRRPPPRKPTRFLGPFDQMPKRKPDYPSHPGMGRGGRMF